MKPPALKPGDTIGVMAPSSIVEKEDVEKSTAFLKDKGYKVFVHPQTFERENQSAGTHLQKTLALQGLWQRSDIQAIWAAGGGNRSLHIIDSINYDALKEKPKTLIGFSDATSILNAVYAHTGLTTFHGPVFKNLHKHKEFDHLNDLLTGKTPDYPMDKATTINEGEAQGPLVGGNLSIFQYLPQTLPDDFTDGSILFLEDCHEELSRSDKMFLHLRCLGVFEKISGLVIGEFRKMQDSGTPFGFTLEDIVREHTQDLNIPVIMNAPFGHGKTLYTFPIGTKAALKAQNNSISLELLESAVEK
ncbi:MAG: peptidase S66 [Micavibrio sp.]|nr:MAG: peptidase S66 [Micavibrio sp.]